MKKGPGGPCQENLRNATYRSKVISVHLSIQELLKISYIVESCTHSNNLNVF